LIFTPIVWSENIEATTNEEYWSFGNKHNLHKSLWTENDFKERGFEIIDHPYKQEYILAFRKQEKQD
jgi:hypothetical protein